RPHISLFFLFNAPSTSSIYTLSLHDALPILRIAVVRLGLLDQQLEKNVYISSYRHGNVIDVGRRPALVSAGGAEDARLPRIFHRDRKSTRLNSSHLVISYAVFCLKKKKN